MDLGVGDHTGQGVHIDPKVHVDLWVHVGPVLGVGGLGCGHKFLKCNPESDYLDLSHSHLPLCSLICHQYSDFDHENVLAFLHQMVWLNLGSVTLTCQHRK